MALIRQTYSTLNEDFDLFESWTGADRFIRDFELNQLAASWHMTRCHWPSLLSLRPLLDSLRSPIEDKQTLQSDSGCGGNQTLLSTAEGLQLRSDRRLFAVLDIGGQLGLCFGHTNVDNRLETQYR